MTRLRLVQLGLLLSGLAVAVAVLVHLLRYRAERARLAVPVVARSSPPPARPSASAAPPSSGGTDITFTRTVGAFRQVSVQAARVDEKDGERVLSGGVRIQGEGRDGFSYAVAVDTVRGDRDWQRVSLSKDLRIRRSDGLTLDADSAEHYEREHADVARGQVRIQSEQRVVLCERAEYKSDRGELFLDGGVRVMEREPGRPPQASVSEHLYFHRKDEKGVLRDGVRALSGPLAILADRLDLALRDGKPIEAVFRGHGSREILIESWNPAACGSSGREATLRLMRMKGMKLLFNEQGDPVRAHPADDDTPVLVDGRDGGELLWSFTAGKMDVAFAPGARVREVVLGGGVLWREESLALGARSAASLRAPAATVTFSDPGGVASARFPAGLELKQEGHHLHAQKGSYRDGVLSVTGAPRLESERQRIEARQIDIATATSALTATGEVRTESTARGGMAGPFGQGDEPLLVRADRLDHDPSTQLAVYRGHARAWQGASVLEADEIRVDTTLGGIEAEGSVRAILVRAGGDRASAAAHRLLWRGQRIDLLGEASASGDDLELSADRVVVMLEADQRTARSLEAEGSVVASRQGTRATASRLEHQVRSGETTLLSGAKMVHVTAQDGSQTWGDRIVLLRRGERVEIGATELGVARTRLNPADGAVR